MLTLEPMETLFPTKELSKTRFNLVRYRAELVESMNLGTNITFKAILPARNQMWKVEDKEIWSARSRP